MLYVAMTRARAILVTNSVNSKCVSEEIVGTWRLQTLLHRVGIVCRQKAQADINHAATALTQRRPQSQTMGARLGLRALLQPFAGQTHGFPLQMAASNGADQAAICLHGHPSANATRCRSAGTHHFHQTYRRLCQRSAQTFPIVHQSPFRAIHAIRALSAQHRFDSKHKSCHFCCAADGGKLAACPNSPTLPLVHILSAIGSGVVLLRPLPHCWRPVAWPPPSLLWALPERDAAQLRAQAARVPIARMQRSTCTASTSSAFTKASFGV